MTAAPWFKFYAPDWRADPALRMCSLAARGLWMEMLCLMHEAAPRGSLLVNGAPVTDRQLAALAGSTPREVTACLSELEEAGVFSRDSGVIFSRRMRRDTEKAERDKANGKGGGNPRLKGEDNGGVNPRDKAQEPEARSQKEETRGERADPDFEQFWAAYPHKVGKPAARRAWPKALKSAGSTAVILDGLSAYQRSKPTDRPWLNPATFLNQERWNDRPALSLLPPPSADNGGWAPPPGFPEGWPRNIPVHSPEIAYKLWVGNGWPPAFGPRPGEPGCKLPAAVVADWQERRAKDAA